MNVYIPSFLLKITPFDTAFSQSAPTPQLTDLNKVQYMFVIQINNIYKL
jgi:hypothetical protein